ncbi:MAG TPA: ribonuclease HII [Firmicutes bacterium]|nr:ribonuclease HII [Bacillota bacterium]
MRKRPIENSLFDIPDNQPTPESVDSWYRSKGYRLIAGVDEAGRGALAGPVSAAAVILDEKGIAGLADSKKLTPETREELFDQIWKMAQGVGVAMVSQEIIDSTNILRAAMEAMKLAVMSLPVNPEIALIDGNRTPVIGIDSVAIVKGDTKSQAIMAASIVAKVTRDRFMDYSARQYPRWGFDRHKGYATKSHIEALTKHGLSIIHRKTFSPCNEFDEKLHDNREGVTIRGCAKGGLG